MDCFFFFFFALELLCKVTYGTRAVSLSDTYQGQYPALTKKRRNYDFLQLQGSRERWWWCCCCCCWGEVIVDESVSGSERAVEHCVTEEGFGCCIRSTTATTAADKVSILSTEQSAVSNIHHVLPPAPDKRIQNPQNPSSLHPNEKAPVQAAGCYRAAKGEYLYYPEYSDVFSDHRKPVYRLCHPTRSARPRSGAVCLRGCQRCA